MASDDLDGDDTPSDPDDLTEDDDFENLTEPRFKYKRFFNDFNKIWQNDAASAIGVHSKFIALGTQWGKIYILDHLGNSIRNVANIIPDHMVAVNQISIDANGDYIGSCSNDGKVVISGLWSSEFNQKISMDRPIRSVAIHPDYGKASSGQQFVTGDRCLTLHERGLFTKDKQHIIYAGRDRDGHIHTISWHKSLIAFANDTGVRVYDKEFKALITHVSRTHDLTLRCDLFPAHITWKSQEKSSSAAASDNTSSTTSSFIVGWANTVTVCDVKTSARALDASNPGCRSYGEIRNMWDLGSHFVSGVSWTEPSGQMVVFAVSSDAIIAAAGDQDVDLGEGSTVSPSGSQIAEATDVFEAEDETGEVLATNKMFPRVLLLEAISLQEYDKLTEDIIVLRDSDKLLCHQYQFAGLPEENMYFILALKDVIMIRPCNADDHVTWLLENEQFQKALGFACDAEAEGKPLTTYSKTDVGKMYLNSLLEAG